MAATSPLNRPTRSSPSTTPRRPPHPRDEPESPASSTTRIAYGVRPRPRSNRSGGATGQGAQTPGDRGRASPTRAISELRRFPQTAVARRRGAGLHGHGAHRRVRRGRRPFQSVPRSDFVTEHDEHQSAQEPTEGDVALRETMRTKDLDRTMYLGVQGGPLMHVITAKTRCTSRKRRPASQAVSRARGREIIANAEGLAVRRSPPPASRPGRRRHRRHLILIDHLLKDKNHRQGRRGPRSAERGASRSSERDPLRRAAADEPLGPADRHPGADHARAWRRRRWSEIAAVIATALGADFESEKDVARRAHRRPDGPPPAVPAAHSRLGLVRPVPPGLSIEKRTFRY